MPVQLQYIQLITDKTNAANLPGAVFAILITVTRMKEMQDSLLFHRFHQNWQTVT